jgi:hypothetical protein
MKRIIGCVLLSLPLVVLVVVGWVFVGWIVLVPVICAFLTIGSIGLGAKLLCD